MQGLLLMYRLLLGLVLTVLGTLLYAAPTKANQLCYTADQIQADIDAIESGIAKTHPNLAHSITLPHFASALANVRQRVRDGMDRDAVWRELSTINPLLADGHLFISYADWRGDTAKHLRNGGTLFPFEMSVDSMGRLRILSELGGAPTKYAGRSVKSINGIPARLVAQELLSRVHGDSPNFRSHLLSKRWWLFYWKVYGAPQIYNIEWDRSGRDVLHAPGSHMQPAILSEEEDFDRNFTLDLRADGIAVMTVRTFSWSNPEAFFAFTSRAFQQMRDAKIGTLIIDVRENGGGDDAMWLKGLLPYFADRPFRWASRYTKRVLKDNPAQAEKTGDVLTGAIDTWTSPLPDGSSLRFDGKVYVLVGRGTYSSAVLFANTVQDFAFGTLIGEGGNVRTVQSGGIQRIELPNTGLVLWSPRFTLVRPSGKLDPEWLTPDIVMTDNTLNSEAMIESAIAATKGHAH